MPRPPRVIHPDEIYHLTARGANRAAIFVDDDDRQRFLMRLGATARRRSWSCLAYCLMGNHVHLVVRGPGGALSSGMRDLLGGHGMAFNHRHGRTGHVFGERFHHVHVAHHRQLLATIRYVALNPVRAGLVARPEEWPWSSYGALVDGLMHPYALDAAALLDLMGGAGVSRWQARQRLIAHVEGGVPEALVEARVRAV